MTGTKTALSLGGNLGDVELTFNKAIAKLAKAGLSEIRKSSSCFSQAEDCLADTPAFTNIAVTGIWPGSPVELLDLCQRIERSAGRPADHLPGTSRTLDIDIILFGEELYADSRLRIPHIKAASRLFVIIPLNEIAHDWIFPGKGVRISQVYDELVNKKTEQKQIGQLFT